MHRLMYAANIFARQRGIEPWTSSEVILSTRFINREARTTKLTLQTVEAYAVKLIVSNIPI